MSYRIGIDVGGTFTDFLLVGPDGLFLREKNLSTPPDFSVGMVEGLSNLAKAEGIGLKAFLERVDLIIHGTTVATNALLTRSGARVGLLTTRGFRDALAMRRGVKEDIYDNKATPPPPIVPRRHRLPVAERILQDGTVEQELVENDVREAIEAFGKDDLEAVAICFMHSYADGSHEKAAKKIVESLLAKSFVSASSELSPRAGFYDRLSTTVLNAYTGPVMATYLRALSERLSGEGFRGTLLVMLSSGGVSSLEIVAETPVAAVRSGPAACSVATANYAALHSSDHAISFDMGGTSLDVASIVDGKPTRVPGADFNLYRIGLPMVDLVSVGAGGGSIAWLDAGGLMHVGPGSAGADPGPASYKLGGTRPTVTDADLILGYIDPAGLVGGRVPLDQDAARAAIEREIAQPLGISVEEAAGGIHDVVNLQMAAAVREFLHERGHDSRDFTLVVAGGAGPIHAALVAEELGIGTVIVPRDSAILSAVGLLQADLKHDFVQTFFGVLDELELESLRSVYSDLMVRGKETLDLEGVGPEDHYYELSADLRYERQINDIEVPLTLEMLQPDRVNEITEAFHRLHQASYGYRVDDSRIEFINARVSAAGRVQPLGTRVREGSTESKPTSSRKVRLGFDVGFEEVPVFEADAMGAGLKIDGACLVRGPTMSLLVPPRWGLGIDPQMNFILRHNPP